MSSHVTENLASRGLKSDFKFSDTASFRLFVEGIKGLGVYERSAGAQGLEIAEKKLAECVAEYPRDVLPQFYLGIVKTFQGYRGVDEAIRIFEGIARDVPALRAPAMYNLASAYIEQYSPQSLDAARDWLKKCIAELGKTKKPEQVSLRLQAQVLLLFYEIRQRLWVKRTESAKDLAQEIRETLPQLQGDLDKFLLEADAAARIPDKARQEIMADYWNDRGLLDEFRAWIEPEEKSKQDLARVAIQSYRESLKWKLNWIPPKSNIARVQIELLKEYDSAIQLCQEVLQVRKDDNYVEYLLGQAWECKDDPQTAISHYEKATFIPEAKKPLASLYERHGRLSDAILLWQKILAKRADDKDALDAQSRLGFKPATPASSVPPKA